MASSDQLRNRAGSLRRQFPERRQATPPAETGRRIGTIARSADEEIRVAWCEYEGRPYVSVRIWNRDSNNGSWWPDPKKGMSIRLRELPGIAEAIAAAIDLAEEHQQHSQAGQTAQGEAARTSAGRSEGDGQRSAGRAPGGPHERRGCDSTGLPERRVAEGFSEF